MPLCFLGVRRVGVFYNSRFPCIGMGDPQTIKLFVQSSTICVQLLTYVDKVIKDVNAMGTRILVEKVDGDDTEQLDAFRRRGIERLPALVLTDGTTRIGDAKIRALIDDNLRRLRADDKFNANAEFGTNTEMADFWGREMFSGVDKKGGRVPRQDDDEADDENDAGDIARRLDTYRRNVPRHRRSGGERDVDRAPVRASRYDDDDNIADDDEDVDDDRGRGDRRDGRDTRRADAAFGAPSDDAAGDAMDRKMLDVYMDNNM